MKRMKWISVGRVIGCLMFGADLQSEGSESMLYDSMTPSTGGLIVLSCWLAAKHLKGS